MGYYNDVRRIVRQIPRGKVATYGDIARASGHPGTARQVAWALRGADIRGLPWQRVLGSGGRILLPGEGGFYQRALLCLEGVQFVGQRVDMKQCAFRFRKSEVRGPKSKVQGPRISECCEESVQLRLSGFAFKAV